MNKKHSVVALIPARGGSKSIPLKNIKDINGRPLIYWALDAAVQCGEIDAVYVSTDDESIKNCVGLYGSSKIRVIDRPCDTATDTASTESVMLDFTNRFMFDSIVLIQATSPLLSTKFLTEGINKHVEDGYTSVLSVVRQKRFLWEYNESMAKPINYNPINRPRRQELEGYFVENGAFYITSREALIKSNCRISGRTAIVEMPENSYFEIDEPDDWIIVEQLLKRKYFGMDCRKDFHNKLKKIKALFMDSDGVLTDGGMYYSENGDELKKFNTKDGMAIKLLNDTGIITGIITGETRQLVSDRSKKMLVTELFMGVEDKIRVIESLEAKYDIDKSEIAYIGDDINDLEVIKRVGLGIAVSDAMDCVRAAAYYITCAKGGQGAVREIAEMIIKSKNAK